MVVVFGACAPASPTAMLGNHAVARDSIRLVADGPRPETCATRGAYRPDLGARIRAFAAARLTGSSRVVRETVVELPSQGTLVEAAANLARGEVALVVEPRDEIGILWVVHPAVLAIYCIHVNGDELVLQPLVTRITRTLE